MILCGYGFGSPRTRDGEAMTRELILGDSFRQRQKIILYYIILNNNNNGIY